MVRVTSKQQLIVIVKYAVFSGKVIMNVRPENAVLCNCTSIDRK